MFDLLASQNIQLKQWPNISIKREDAIHPDVSGNKYRKLHLNLAKAKQEGYQTILTFGGAYSNHIAATAAAGALFGFNTIGVIRGEELANVALNPTLAYACDMGMRLSFISREKYREKSSPSMLEAFRHQFGEIYVIPEGGTNLLAIEGCRAILAKMDGEFDIITTPVGTGGTITGLIQSAREHQTVMGFPALKGEFLQKEIQAWLDQDASAVEAKWQLIHQYHFGGYGKTTDELIHFINYFYQTEGILLDPIYTGKMVFGVIDRLNKGFIPQDSKVLMIHTGGLQGIKGVNQRQLEQKKMVIQCTNHPLFRTE